jgi:hypothetical protein
MSETQKRTPTPWRASRARKSSNFGAYVAFVQTSDPPSVLAKVSGGPTDDREVAEANAAFIVRAVNAHDDLVKALELIEVDLTAGDMPHKTRVYLALDRVRAALSKAGE